VPQMLNSINNSHLHRICQGEVPLIRSEHVGVRSGQAVHLLLLAARARRDSRQGTRAVEGKRSRQDPERAAEV
jgi:hypothetical protein